MQVYKCDNCESAVWGEGSMKSVFPDIPKLSERIAPGGVVPAGECSECGALMYPADVFDLLPKIEDCRQVFKDTLLSHPLFRLAKVTQYKDSSGAMGAQFYLPEGTHATSLDHGHVNGPKDDTAKHPYHIAPSLREVRSMVVDLHSVTVNQGEILGAVKEQATAYAEDIVAELESIKHPGRLTSYHIAMQGLPVVTMDVKGGEDLVIGAAVSMDVVLIASDK